MAGPPRVDRPLIVIEGPPGCAAAEIERARRDDWAVVDGFLPPIGREHRVICTGVVADEPSAAAALLAALAGAGLIVEARADRPIVDRLVDDLRRLGPVVHRDAERAAGPAPGPTLAAEARAMLGLLAEGHSLGEAADILGLARRTADRRLAEARRSLGVQRTTEAIARARRLGWLGSRMADDR